MTTTYQSKHVTHGTPAAKPARNNKKKKAIVVSGLVAALALPAAAWAAVELFGFGTLDAAAATTQNLTVDPKTTQLIGKLIPGSTVGVQAEVTNPNDFPVTVNAVIVNNKKFTGTPDNSKVCVSSVHLVGTPTTWPDGGGGGGAGTLQDIKAPVTIPAGKSAVVEVPKSVSQDAAATVLCGVHVEFAVRAETA